MADEEKIGKPWNDDELDAIVADYFSMLRAELSRQPYVKSHHSAVLMKQVGRTHRSVEFKHQNVSAVLEEMGLPWIVGYKPKRNYQASIFGAIDRYLSSNGDVVYHQLPPKVLAVAEDAGTFVKAPELEPQSERPWQLERLVRKFDPVERDLRNHGDRKKETRKIPAAGSFEKNKVGIGGRWRWCRLRYPFFRARWSRASNRSQNDEWSG